MDFFSLFLFFLFLTSTHEAVPQKKQKADGPTTESRQWKRGWFPARFQSAGLIESLAAQVTTSSRWRLTQKTRKAKPRPPESLLLKKLPEETNKKPNPENRLTKTKELGNQGQHPILVLKPSEWMNESMNVPISWIELNCNATQRNATG